jgi:glycosyltransferase involved in cell wall biosynthesis
MRVLHLADRLSNRGGSYTWTLGIVEGLRATHEQLLAVGVDAGEVRHPCRVVLRHGLESRDARDVDLDSIAREFRPDVVHVHNITNPCVLEWASARGRALVTVQDHRFFCPARGKWTASGEVCGRSLSRGNCASCFDDSGYFDEVLELTERRLAAARRLAVSVLSRYMREQLVAAGAAPQSIFVIPPFVHDLDNAAAADGPPCVLFVGRLAEAKGVRDAIRAWRRSGVELPLVLAGTGPLRAELEAYAREASGPPLQVLGWVERGRLAGLYQRARALVMPSRWQEPYGIAGIEALSFGVPVVAWESGGVGEWHPGPGLVRWGDVSGLAGALSRAVERRLLLLPRFERDEALGRLVRVYARVAEGLAGA